MDGAMMRGTGELIADLPVSVGGIWDGTQDHGVDHLGFVRVSPGVLYDFQEGLGLKAHANGLFAALHERAGNFGASGIVSGDLALSGRLNHDYFTLDLIAESGGYFSERGAEALIGGGLKLSLFNLISVDARYLVVDPAGDDQSLILGGVGFNTASLFW